MPARECAASPYPEEEALETPETTSEPVTPTPAPWFQRVLPVTAVAVVLVGLTALLLPAFRNQVELSTSRRSQPYVELYFARTARPAGQAVCLTRGNRALVRFVVASHLPQRRVVTYRIAVDPAARSARAHRKSGSVRVAPGAAAEMGRAFIRPRGAYTVAVSLPALGQQLRAHCPGRRS
jgi:hypothetical protein